MKRNHWVAVLFIAIGFGVVCTQCQKATESRNQTSALSTSAAPAKKAVSIGYQQVPFYRHLFVAQEKGFFKDEKVDVALVPVVSANKMIQAMTAGQLQVTGLTNLQVALLAEAKDPGRFKLAQMLVWKETSFPDYILVRAGVAIRKIEDLKGRSLGHHPGSAVKAFAVAVLNAHHVDPKSVRFLELEPAQMQGAIAAGKIDALYCMDPEASVIVDKRLATVLMPNPMKEIFQQPVPISGTALSADFITKDRSRAVAIVRALDRAIEYIRRPGTDQEVAVITAKYVPASPSAIARMNASEYWMSNEVDAIRVRQLAERFAALGISPVSVDAGSLLLPRNFAR